MNWRDMVKTLETGRKELRQYENMMSPYERDVITRDLKAKTEQYFQPVYAGVVGEFKSAIKRYQDAGAGLQKAKAAEINRWDSSKLDTELASVQRRVALALQLDPRGAMMGGASVAQKLQALYAEAQESGDLHKQRAAAEIIGAALYQVPEGDRHEAIHITEQAKRDLEALRETPEIVQSREAIQKSWDDLQTRREEVLQTGETLAEHSRSLFAVDAFSQAAQMVQVRDGEVRIYKEDDPEVHPQVIHLPDKPVQAVGG